MKQLIQHFSNIVFGAALLALALLFNACGGGKESLDDESIKQNSVSARMTADIISNTTINAFCEDAFGYIWIATERGLNKYNGKDFVQYYRSYSNNNAGLLSSRVTSLFSDSDRRMWIGTVAGINVMSDDDSFLAYEIDGPDKSVRSIFEAKGGTMYVVIGYQLYRLNREANIFEAVHDSTEESVAQSANYIDYVPAGDGNIWHITPRSATLLNGTNLSVICTRQLKHAPTGSYVDDKGNLWLLAPEGLQIVNSSMSGLIPLPANLAKEESGYNTLGIRAIYRYSDEELILVTNDNTVLLYNTVLDR
ncbi:MAG: hypothetical protein IIU82_00320, partial [Tidjanibacter sp.]|nr:hypothetical protein [Tidjanibacter sp.]